MRKRKVPERYAGRLSQECVNCGATDVDIFHVSCPDCGDPNYLKTTRSRPPHSPDGGGEQR